MPSSVLERLTAKSEQTGDCLVWNGLRDKNGYGRISVGDRGFLVHRAAWIERHGPIPPDTPHVLHRCDNPPCWAEAHLFLGTQADNLADMRRKGRERHPRKTHCRNGHAYDKANTHIRVDGAQECRKCGNAKSKRHRDRKKGTS